MKTLLIAINNSTTNTQNAENLGLERMYAYLRTENKEVDIIYITQVYDIKNTFLNISSDYDIYAFSVYNNNLHIVYELSMMIKNTYNMKYIILGSKFVTSYYEDIFEYAKKDGSSCIDCIVLGDGEYPMLEIINCLEQGKNLDEYAIGNPHIVTSKFMKNKKPLSIDINELPLPERNFLKQTNYIAAYICDSHGCVGKCSFCIHSIYHHKWSGRTAASLFNEVSLLYENTNAKWFLFTSASVADPGKLGKDRINDFCDLVIQSKLKVGFKCFLRADSFKEEKNDIYLLTKMKKAGFNHMFVGIESANDDDLSLYCKTATVNDNYMIMKLLKDVGIFSGGYGFIMFNPYSNLEKIRENYFFISKNQPFQIWQFISKLTIFKGTKMHDLVKKDNLLKKTTEKTLNLIDEYYFQNKEIEDLFNYIRIKLHTPKLNMVIQNTEDISSSINCLSHLPYTEKALLELNDILSCYEIILKEYFFHLYVNNDIEFCEKIYDEFLNEIFENDRKLQLLNNKFTKSMIKNNIILS